MTMTNEESRPFTVIDYFVVPFLRPYANTTSKRAKQNSESSFKNANRIRRSELKTFTFVPIASRRDKSR